MTKTERQQIRDCAKVFFTGGNPYADEELKDDWLKWEFFFNTAMFCLDARYGNWLNSPFGCCVADFPMKSFEAYELIQNLFREKLDAEMNVALSKAKYR